MKALVNKIIPFSNVDGDGNRIAIFLQGCPFNCLYCHNPETINVCCECGTCVEHCPTKAITMKQGALKWDESKCCNCDRCIKVCPHKSSPKVKEYTPKDLLEAIKKYFPFTRGVTFSGGECMRYAAFIEEFAALLQPYHKSLLLDSNGYYLFEEYPRLLSLIDGVMLDVKAFDLEQHVWLVGVSNANTIRNLQYLQHVNKLYEVRTVILPEQTAMNESTVLQVISLLKSEIPYKLLAYRPYGVRDEYRELLSNHTTSQDELHRLKELCEKNGYKTIKIV